MTGLCPAPDTAPELFEWYTGTGAGPFRYTLVMKDFWYVYVLRSEKDREFYIGSTNDLDRRFAEHQSGKNISTMQRAVNSIAKHQKEKQRYGKCYESL